MTDKERAQERRALANELRAQRNYIGADYLDRSADELDPPEPEIPDGHVWYRRDKNDPWTAGVCNGFDRLFNRFGNQFMVDNVEIVSVQTLEPGQVAVDRRDARSAINALHLQGEEEVGKRIITALDRAEQEVSE